RFLYAARDYLEPNARDVENAGQAGRRHSAYHRYVVRSGIACGVVGLVLAVAFPVRGDDHLETTLTFGMAGGVFGVGLVCCFVPQEFLTGPVGRKWMKLIGVRSVVAARIACVLLAVAVLGLITLWAVEHQARQGPAPAAKKPHDMWHRP